MTLTLKNVKIFLNDDGKSIVFKLYLANLNMFNVQISPSENQIIQEETSMFVITNDYRHIPRINVSQLMIERINFIDNYVFDLN
jgi:hypothetical protein